MRPLRATVLTPPGTGAIGVVRLQGEQTIQHFNTFFQPASGRPLSETDGDRLRYGHFTCDGEVIDDIIATCLKSGGEETVDISAHGGVRIIERILLALAGIGAIVEEHPTTRSAWPAASMLEREALEAILMAKTKRAVCFAAAQRRLLPEAIGRLANAVVSDPSGVRRELQAIAERYSAARLLIEGLNIAVVGPPNAGKSTLMNRWVGREAAVVSPQPGTTLDWVTHDVEVAGFPVTLIDTAGGRDAIDELERRAIAAGRGQASRADVRLLLLDSSRNPGPADWTFVDAIRADAKCLVVLNKGDLPGTWTLSELKRLQSETRGEPIRVSAQTGRGMDDLFARILQTAGTHQLADHSPAWFTRRQFDEAAKVIETLAKPEISQGPANFARLIHGDSCDIEIGEDIIEVR